jgi:hypothetical protein
MRNEENTLSGQGTDSRFFGVVPAMATPFRDDDRALDEGRVRALIEWYLESGVHGISVAGSQGEFFSLDDDERLRLIRIAVDTIRGRVPLYAGTGAVTTARRDPAHARGGGGGCRPRARHHAVFRATVTGRAGGSLSGDRARHATAGDALQQSTAHVGQRAARHAGALHAGD